MSKSPEFEFEFVSACQNTVRKACPEVATNVPCVVAFRDSERPDTVVTMEPESWRSFVDAAKAGAFDLGV